MKLPLAAFVAPLLAALGGCSSARPPSAVETELVRLAQNRQSGDAQTVSTILGATLTRKDQWRTETGADCKDPADIRTLIGEQYAAAKPSAGRWDTILFRQDRDELCDGTIRHADRLQLRGLRIPECSSLASLSDRFSTALPWPGTDGIPSFMARDYVNPALGSSVRAGFEMVDWNDKSDCIRNAYVLAFYRTRL
ncbi:hypothetical protein [Roseomonas elaeocarpi]|uniref:Lipoprotein n=1 Tax=Roseomonas elaeocarpi TaxID=907779 RepID=A0ABV6JUU0_9PROT